MVSQRLTALITERASNGRTFSPPGSLWIRAISAEASSTYSDKGLILLAILMEFIDQADIPGDVATDDLLCLAYRLIERRDLDAIGRPAENHFFAIVDAK